MSEEIKITFAGDIVCNKNSFVIRLSNAIITYIRSIPAKELYDKSNSKKIIRQLVKFTRLTHSDEYKEWCKSAKQQIMDQIEYETYWEEVHIDFTIFFSREGLAGGDCSNRQQSIEDALQECGVIDNDHYQCLSSYFCKGIYRKDNGGAEIIIKKIR